ncbi:MAG: hypothetical protein QOC80_1109, partial [Frankiaceae bacterium]|nr:hypothetical protein [Frankiaceae bacterium]
AQADIAAREAPDARPHEQVDRPSAAPDFAALIESSLLARYGEDAVYSQDLQVATPLDLDLQAALDVSVRRLVPQSGATVLAVATDPRTGDIRALTNRGSAAPGSPQAGADGVLFARRPLGTLAGQLPTVLGDGRSASVGEVAAGFGAVAGGGTRHDLRSLTRVSRPRSVNGPAAVLDSAEALPPGQPMVAPEQANTLTAAFRATGRRITPEIPFALAGAQGAAGPDAWYVGCVPELCLTVWISGAGTTTEAATPVPAQVLSTPPLSTPPLSTPSLPAEVAAATFTGYLTAAPDRISVPALPVPRTEARRPADHGTPRSAEATVAPTRAPTAAPSAPPSPRARVTPPPSVAPSPATTATATPTPKVTPPTDGAGPPTGDGDGGPQAVAEGSPRTGGLTGG